MNCMKSCYFPINIEAWRIYKSCSTAENFPPANTRSSNTSTRPFPTEYGLSSFRRGSTARASGWMFGMSSVHCPTRSGRCFAIPPESADEVFIGSSHARSPNKAVRCKAHYVISKPRLLSRKVEAPLSTRLSHRSSVNPSLFEKLGPTSIFRSLTDTAKKMERLHLVVPGARLRSSIRMWAALMDFPQFAPRLTHCVSKPISSHVASSVIKTSLIIGSQKAKTTFHI